MVRVIRSHWRNMKNSIINGSEVSGLSVTIQSPFIIECGDRLDGHFWEKAFTLSRVQGSELHKCAALTTC